MPAFWLLKYGSLVKPSLTTLSAPTTCTLGLYDFLVDVQGHYGYGSHPPGAEAEEARQEDAALWHSLTARNLHPHGWECTEPSLLNKPNSALQALVRYAKFQQDLTGTCLAHHELESDVVVIIIIVVIITVVVVILITDIINFPLAHKAIGYVLSQFFGWVAKACLFPPTSSHHLDVKDL